MSALGSRGALPDHKDDPEVLGSRGALPDNKDDPEALGSRGLSNEHQRLRRA